MKSGFSIRTIFAGVMLLTFLFSSQIMKQDEDRIAISVSWLDGDSLAVEGADYPEDLKGLPLISVPLEGHNISGYEILAISRTELTDAPEQWAKSLKNHETVSLRHLTDRGNRNSFLQIIPVNYDTIAGKYFRIDKVDIKLNRSSTAKISAAARKSNGPAHSVLATGDWYKIPVTTAGIYKIDYNYLKSAGINPSAIDPRNIKLYGNGGGMLPQANNAPRPADLIENAIFVMGESDGLFDKDDYILFYGQDADNARLQADGTLQYQKNFYSDTTFYFLTVGQDKGLRISPRENLGDNHPKVMSFDDYITYEKDEHNIINSGREWFGEKFDFTYTYDFKFDFEGLIPDSKLTVTTSILGQTYQEASMDVFVNGKLIGQQPIYAIKEGSYLAKGSLQQETFEIQASQVISPQQFTVRLSYNPAGSGMSKANLNYFIVQGERALKLYGNQTRFRSVASTQNAISTFEMDNASSVFQIWDVTDPLHPYNQNFSLNGEKAVFGAFTDELREFIAFTDKELPAPGKPVSIPNQDLHSLPSVDFLIVSHPAFLSQAERLADLRRTHDGLSVLVVTPQQIYNEFSSGKQDVTAIRDFVRYLYLKGNNGNRLSNVLLFGKGSFDYKDRIDGNMNFVPIYSSRNSVHPINSYSSDDYYGFMDESEGEWEESYSGDLYMDIGVGRLPVKTPEDARIVVDKLYRYAYNPATFGKWRNDIVFIADDGDGSLHMRDADRLATLVDTSYSQINIHKIYVDAYPQEDSPIGEIAPKVNEEIENSLFRGGLIFNFTGHGSTTRWTSETILNISSVMSFENNYRLPLFVTATCEFGRHDNPRIVSGGEYMILNEHGGAIGLVTTARPVYSSTNFMLNRAFYQSVFRKTGGRYLMLGEVFRLTKNLSLNGNVNRNFSLLGDPSMTLAYAKQDIRLIADGNVYAPGDTISALSTVKLKGEILNDSGTRDATFNGRLNVTVFGQPVKHVTLGNENPPMTYYERDNIIFSGTATVKGGAFDIEFIVPKDIDFEFGESRVSLYACDSTRLVDAGGSEVEFVIGGQSDDFIPDNTPPEIWLYINDTSFVNGGITGKDILLVARLFDESGISTASIDPARTLSAVLDEGKDMNLSKYYVTEPDTWQAGWVTYPIKDLSIGTHTIRLQAWDVHGNYNEAEIEFVVTEDADLVIDKLVNFPNPFYEQTRFSFEHNRAGEDLEVNIAIYNVRGQMVKRIIYTEKNSGSRISNIYWDAKNENGSNMQGGLYIMKLTVRSLRDGSKNQAIQKLILIN